MEPGAHGESRETVPDGFHDLVRSAQDGDRGAMDRVLGLLHPYIERLARPFADPSRPAESTSDLLQDCCLRAWRKLGSFEGGQNDEETFAMFRAWLGRILRNLGLNAQRDRGRKRRSPGKRILSLGSPAGDGSTGSGPGLDAPSPAPSPTTFARTDERSERIRAALDNLPDPTDATIVRMRFFEGFHLTRISEQLGIAYERVKDRYRATIRKLERDLEGLL